MDGRGLEALHFVESYHRSLSMASELDRHHCGSSGMVSFWKLVGPPPTRRCGFSSAEAVNTFFYGREFIAQREQLSHFTG